MFVAVVPDQAAGLGEGADDLRVGLEDIDPGPFGDVLGEPPPVVDRYDTSDGDVVGLAEHLVLLAEPGGHMDHPGALGGVYPVGSQHPEGVGPIGEEVEQRLVGAFNQLGALHYAQVLGSRQLGLVAFLRRGAQNVDKAVGVPPQGVVDVRADPHGQVGRQRPRGGRPGQEPHRSGVVCARFQVEGHSDGRVLAGPRGVVEADLKVG